MTRHALRRALAAAMIAIAFVSLNAGCGASALTGKPAASGDRQGLRYFLAMDLLRIDATTTMTTTREVVFDVVTKEFKVSQKVKHEREGTLGLQPVADTRQSFIVDLKPGGSADSSLDVSVRPNGILESINVSSTGRAGAAFASFARFASSLPATLSLVGLAAAAPERTSDACQPTATADLPVRVRALVSVDLPACKVLLRIRSLEQRLAELRGMRDVLEDKGVAASGAELYGLREKLRKVEERIAATTAELATASLELQQMVDAYSKAQRLGTTTEKVALSEWIDPSAAPTSESVPDPSRWSDIYTKLGAAAQVVAAATCAVVTADPIAAASRAAVSSQLSATGTPAASPEPSPAKGTARLYYRQSRPYRIRLLMVKDRATCRSGTLEEKKALQEAELVEVSDHLVDLMEPNGETRFLEFRGSAFADRKLGLSFDERGRPIKMSRSGTSDTAAVATALADSAKAARDEYAGAMKTIGEAQESRRKVAMDDLLTSAEELKARKAVVEAELQLAQSQSTAGSALRQKQLEAELAQLRAALALQTAQESAPTQAEVDRLKLQIELLKLEVEHLKTQNALDEARSRR